MAQISASIGGLTLVHIPFGLMNLLAYTFRKGGPPSPLQKFNFATYLIAYSVAGAWLVMLLGFIGALALNLMSSRNEYLIHPRFPRLFVAGWRTYGIAICSILFLLFLPWPFAIEGGEIINHMLFNLLAGIVWLVAVTLVVSLVMMLIGIFQRPTESFET